MFGRVSFAVAVAFLAAHARLPAASRQPARPPTRNPCLAGNPIYTGTAPEQWPVNGFLYEDPDGSLVVYAGLYGRNYAMPWSMLALRSTDGGECQQQNRVEETNGGADPGFSIS